MRGRLLLWWLRLRVMTAKELIQLGRDPLLLIIIAWFFTADVYLAGSGISMELKHAPLVVVDLDHSAASRELIHKFREPHFRLLGEVAHPVEGQRMLDSGEAMLLLEIPPGFQRDIRRGLQATAQLRIDTSNTILGTLAAAYSAQIVEAYALELAERRFGTGRLLERAPVIDDRRRVWYNPNQTETWFMSISELLTVITLLSLMLPATAAVREKERGTIQQLIVSPLTPTQVMLPKVVAMTLAILAGTAGSLFLILLPVFQVPVKGSLPLFFLVTAEYVFATAGLGLFIATLARNLGQVTLLVVLVMMPMLLLSGAWTPPEAMPEALRMVMPITPLYHFIEMGYAILLKGAGVDILWDSMLALALIGLALFLFGAWRFRRQLG